MDRPARRSATPAPLALLLVLAAALAACAEGTGVMRTYSGPKLADQEVAKIGGTFKFYGLGAHTVLLHEVDGVPVTEGDLEVLPGAHTVSTTYSSAVITTEFRGVAPCYVTFQAEAGHTYIANGAANDDTWQCWIEDTGTRQRVSGNFTRPPDWKPDAAGGG